MPDWLVHCFPDPGRESWFAERALPALGTERACLDLLGRERVRAVVLDPAVVFCRLPGELCEQCAPLPERGPSRLPLALRRAIDAARRLGLEGKETVLADACFPLIFGDASLLAPRTGKPQCSAVVLETNHPANLRVAKTLVFEDILVKAADNPGGMSVPFPFAWPENTADGICYEPGPGLDDFSPARDTVTPPLVWVRVDAATAFVKWNGLPGQVLPARGDFVGVGFSGVTSVLHGGTLSIRTGMFRDWTNVGLESEDIESRGAWSHRNGWTSRPVRVRGRGAVMRCRLTLDSLDGRGVGTFSRPDIPALWREEPGGVLRAAGSGTLIAGRQEYPRVYTLSSALAWLPEGWDGSTISDMEQGAFIPLPFSEKNALRPSSDFDLLVYSLADEGELRVGAS